jgi:hypothetical protein
MRPFNKIKTLLCIEGIFYLLMGLWPLLHMLSFQKVTGPKTDLWLMITVGGFLCVYGLAFLLESRRPVISNSVMCLAVGIPLVLLWVDVYYVYGGVISAVYMIDALLENIIVFSWLLIFMTR